MSFLFTSDRSCREKVLDRRYTTILETETSIVPVRLSNHGDYIMPKRKLAVSSRATLVTYYIYSTSVEEGAERESGPSSTASLSSLSLSNAFSAAQARSASSNASVKIHRQSISPLYMASLASLCLYSGKFSRISLPSLITGKRPHHMNSESMAALCSSR